MKIKIDTNLTDEQLSGKAILSIVTIRNARKGHSVCKNTALRIAHALKKSLAEIEIKEA